MSKVSTGSITEPEVSKNVCISAIFRPKQKTYRKKSAPVYGIFIYLCIYSLALQVSTIGTVDSVELFQNK